MSGDFICFTKHDFPCEYDQFYDFIRYIFKNRNICGCTFAGGEYFNNEMEHWRIVKA